MKATKLKSGNWNVRVYIGKTADGKDITKSITAPTKKEALQKAALYQVKVTDIDMRTMVLRYIEYRKPVISPTTYRGYVGIYNSCIKDEPIANLPVSRLNDPMVQRWVSRISNGRRPKTVRNAYGLFRAALKFHSPHIDFAVKLPQGLKPKLHTPTTAEISALLEYLKGHNYELYKACLLSAVGMMRQGEIAALTAEDVDRKRCAITINKSLARTIDNQFVVKQPKTEASYRTIIVPQFVIDALPTEGNIITMNPRYITLAFTRVVKKLFDVPFRFHDLRHYAASIAASSSVGASTESIKARGGWATDSVMKRVYINQLPDEVDKDSESIISFYNSNLV